MFYLVRNPNGRFSHDESPTTLLAHTLNHSCYSQTQALKLTYPLSLTISFLHTFTTKFIFFIQTCPSRRRRRNIYDDHVRNLIKSQSASARQTATQEERSQGEQLGGLPDIVGQVHNKLRVFGLEDISVNGKIQYCSVI